MDIYDYLKLDHQQVAHLFKQFSKTEALIRKKQIAHMICEELMFHAESEKQTFYKALEHYEETQESASHGIKEHHEIEARIAEILKIDKMNASDIKKVEALQELVEHHVHEEEHSIFKKAKKVLSEYDAYVLKEQMHYLKQKLKIQEAAI